MTQDAGNIGTVIQNGNISNTRENGVELIIGTPFDGESIEFQDITTDGEGITVRDLVVRLLLRRASLTRWAYPVSTPNGS